MRNVYSQHYNKKITTMGSRSGLESASNITSKTARYTEDNLPTTARTRQN
jgi:hypothetical protein